jgi:cbb3-type cytochrome oxidase maturation protein
MNVLFVLVPLSLLLVICAVWAFIWAVDHGQFDDLESADWQALMSETVQAKPTATQPPRP